VKDKMGLLKLAASANTICKGTVKKMYEMKKENPKELYPKNKQKENESRYER